MYHRLISVECPPCFIEENKKLAWQPAISLIARGESLFSLRGLEKSRNPAVHWRAINKSWQYSMLHVCPCVASQSLFSILHAGSAGSDSVSAMQRLPVLHSYLQQQMHFCLNHSLFEETDIADSMSDTPHTERGTLLRLWEKWKDCQSILSRAAVIICVI